LFDLSEVVRPLHRVTPGCNRGLFTFQPSGLVLRMVARSKTEMRDNSRRRREEQATILEGGVTAESRRSAAL